MEFNRKFFILFLVFILTEVSCTQKSKKDQLKSHDLTSQLSFTDNIKDFINEVEVKEINLDELKTKNIFPTDIIGGITKNNKLILAYPYYSAKIMDSLFIVDQKLNSILVADNKGKITRKIGRMGKGPRDFIKPVFMAYNNKYIAVYEAGNKRIQLFNYKFNFLKMIPANFNDFVNGIGMTDKYLYCKTNMFREAPNIDYYSLNKKDFGKYKGTINIPLIGKPLTKGSIMNNSTFSVNRKGYIFYSYVGIPYLFIFNNQNRHCASIKFNSIFFKKELQKVKVPQKVNNHTTILKLLISAIASTGDKVYVLFSSDKVLLLKFKKCKLLGAPLLYKLNSKDNKTLGITSMSAYGNELFFTETVDAEVLKYNIN